MFEVTFTPAADASKLKLEGDEDAVWLHVIDDEGTQSTPVLFTHAEAEKVIAYIRLVIREGN